METKIIKDPEELNNKIEKHPKQDFQVERLAFFSDAVFAIAITLLVIEFKIPRINGDTTYDDALKQLWDLKYLFIATLLSFYLITYYWRTHHLLFKHIHNYDKKLITFNMLMLLPIIFCPFTTAFLAESLNNFISQTFNHVQGNEKIYLLGIRLFVLNHFFAYLTCYIFYWHAMVKHKELSFTMPVKEKFDFLMDTWFAIIFMGAVFVATFFSNMAILGLAMWLAVILRIIIKRKQKKRLAEEEKLKCNENKTEL